MAVIDDKEMLECMIEDLIENYHYTEDEAKEFAKNNGSSIVNDMWDAYSHYFEEYATFKG